MSMGGQVDVRRRRTSTDAVAAAAATNPRAPDPGCSNARARGGTELRADLADALAQGEARLGSANQHDSHAERRIGRALGLRSGPHHDGVE